MGKAGYECFTDSNVTSTIMSLFTCAKEKEQKTYTLRQTNNLADSEFF